MQGDRGAMRIAILQILNSINTAVGRGSATYAVAIFVRQKRQDRDIPRNTPFFEYLYTRQTPPLRHSDAQEAPGPEVWSVCAQESLRALCCP
jgi:hypothetical protein